MAKASMGVKQQIAAMIDPKIPALTQRSVFPSKDSAILLRKLDAARPGPLFEPLLHGPVKIINGLLSRASQTLLEFNRLVPPVAHQLGVKRGQPEPFAAPRPRIQHIVKRVLDRRRIGPVGAKEHSAGSADQVGHIRERAVEFVRGSHQIIDEDRSLDFELRSEGSRVGKLLLEITMSRVILTRVRLPGVEKNKLNVFRRELSCHRFECRRRQRAVGSGKRAELDQHITLFPVVA